MAQKKTVTLYEIETFANVLQYPKDMKGNWKGFFKNTNPLSWSLPVAKANSFGPWAECTQIKTLLGLM